MIRYSFPAPSGLRREPFRVVVAPIDTDEQLGAAGSFPIEGREGSFALELPAEREWLGVRVSFVSDLGLPGRTLTVRFEQAESRERAG